MNNVNYIYRNRYRHVYSLLLFVLTVLLGSCTNSVELSPDPETSTGTMVVRLNLPGMKSPVTKGMTPRQENTLDLDQLNVFAVKGFSFYKAKLIGSIVYDPADHSKATITVQLPKEVAKNDAIKLGVTANYTLSGSLPPVWGVFRLAQILSVPGEWPSNQLIPMWGESATAFVVNDTMGAQTVDMYRSLARVDVGLNFTEENGKLTETAQGFPGFKINSVYLHGTRDNMFVCTAATSGNPNIPTSNIRDRNNPLKYENLGSVDSYVREIYIPEAAVQTERDKKTCIVVGGFFGGSTTETYYRLDFVKANGDGSTTPLPILRNHRYVINIKEVKSKGAASVQEAFDRVGAVGNSDVVYTVEVLDDYVHYVELQGEHYFGVDNRNVVFDPQAAMSHIINYQTDLTETLTLDWANPTTGTQRYNIIMGANGSFLLSTKTKNVSGETYVDSLYVKMGTFSIPIQIEQRSANLQYAIDCQSVKVNGSYIVGQPLGASHFIDLTILAEDNSLQGERYIIETEDPAGNHGISFKGEGTFSFTSGPPYSMNIRLQGTGQLDPLNGTDLFKLRIKTNSGTGDYCETTIVPVHEKMTVVTLGNKADGLGFTIDRLNGGSGKVINHPNNFGPNDNSIIKMAGFNYINSVEDFGGYLFAPYTNSQTYKYITGIEGGVKKHPLADIVYIEYYGTIDNASATLLANYLDDGGTIVAFCELPANATALVNKLYGFSNITGALGGGNGRVYPMPANPALFTGPTAEEDRQAVMRKFQGDPILNGPFGDVRDKQIGDDRVNGCTFSNLPTGGIYEDIVTVYSYNNDINTATPVTNSTHVFGFKYEDRSANGRNLFFWGDSGLMTSLSGNPYNGAVVGDHYPFNWDPTTFFPVVRENYGLNASYRKPVYNSTMFCNVMAWAVKRSQELKQRRMNAVGQ